MDERSGLAERLERELDEAGLHLAVEDRDGAIVLSGIVVTTRERDAAHDIVSREVGGARTIEDNIEVGGALPGDTSLGELSEVEIAGFAGAEADLEEDERLLPGDFTDQETTSAAEIQAAALSGSPGEEPDRASSGDLAYVPPTDPASRGDRVIGGFQGSSMDTLEVERSSDGTIGDEAIRDAVIRELLEDAATTALDLGVEVVAGVVHLTGRVDDIDDVESSEEVAARVPGVVEVVEHLEVVRLG